MIGYVKPPISQTILNASIYAIPRTVNCFDDRQIANKFRDVPKLRIGIMSLQQFSYKICGDQCLYENLDASQPST